MAVRYAGPDPESWLRSLGIAAIVGTILTINATPHGGRISDLGFWAIFRFFLIPFSPSISNKASRGVGWECEV